MPPQSRINMICHRLLSSVLWALHLPVTDNIAWTYNTGYIGAWTFSRDSACQLGLDRFDYSIVPIPPIIQAANQTIVLNSDEKAWRGCVNRLRFCASVKKKLSSFQTVWNVTFGMNGMWLSLVDENKYECGWERNTINSCWGAAPQIEHRIAGCGKTTKSSSFWQFFEQFSPKTSNLYIKNTYFANKIGSDTISWAEEGLKHFGQSQGGLPPPTQLTNTKNTMSNTSRLSRAIY